MCVRHPEPCRRVAAQAVLLSRPFKPVADDANDRGRHRIPSRVFDNSYTPGFTPCGRKTTLLLFLKRMLMNRKKLTGTVYALGFALLTTASIAFHAQQFLGGKTAPGTDLPKELRLTDAACHEGPAPSFPLPVFPVNI